jgi:hypothetical protein
MAIAHIPTNNNINTNNDATLEEARKLLFARGTKDEARKLAEIAKAQRESGAPIIKVTKKPEHKIVMPLSEALWQSFEPLVHALDQDVDFADMSSKMPDTGHTKPSVTDKGMLSMIKFAADNLHRQAYGVIVTKSGSYPNAQTRALQSAQDYEEHVNRYDGDIAALMSNPRTLTLIHWKEVNEARLQMIDEQFEAYKYCYEKLTNEQYIPPSYENVSAPVETDDAKKARVKAYLEKTVGADRAKTLIKN